MRFWFRVPNWYRFSVLVAYTFVAIMVLEKPLPLSGMGLLVYTLLALSAMMIFRMWNAMIGVDTEERTVIMGKKRISADEIVRIDFGMFGMSVLFRLRDGRGVVYPYPIEDRQEFERLLNDLLGSSKLEV